MLGLYSPQLAVLAMPNPDHLIRALAAIEPGVCSMDEFQIISGIQGKLVARNVFEFFAAIGAGRILANGVSFSSTDRMKAAIKCIQYGCDIGQVSSQISWRDFEQLASEVLKSFGYRTTTNVRFVRPRMEIDVVGVQSSTALVIDCKHWTHTNRLSISNYSRRQADRARRLVEREGTAKRAIPLILTLYSESVKFVDRIPIVPIVQLRSFLADMQAYLDEIHIIGRS